MGLELLEGCSSCWPLSQRHRHWDALIPEPYF